MHVKLKKLTTLEIWASKLKLMFIFHIYNDAENEVGPLREHIFHAYKIKALMLISKQNSVQSHACTSQLLSEDRLVKSKQA